MLVDQSAKFFLADPFCVRDHHLSRSEDGSAFVPLRVSGYAAKLGDKGGACGCSKRQEMSRTLYVRVRSARASASVSCCG
jgi:hypothetical protein